MATIREVARRAGVAPITVSRVINNAGPVNADTRLRVEAAITELNYVPNTLARSFRSKRTQTLALILPDITNPFWTRVARGVEDTARQAGYSVFLCNTDEKEEIQLETVHSVLRRQVDGILLVPRRNGAELVTRIRQQDTTVVVLDRRVAGQAVDTVLGDSEGGAYQLTCLLLKQGHRYISLLSGPADVPTSADRAAGFFRAMSEAGLKEEGRVYFGEFTYASGIEMASQVLSTAPRATAIFAGNNLIGTGVLRTIQAANLHVPADISLVSFDDFPPDLTIEPFFTTADQPPYEMGRQATRLLLDRLSGVETGLPREIVLPVEIIVRRSSGQAPI
jgi:LacI family transcriptional regulator